MVLDASAIVAILNREEGYRHMIARMETAEELSTCGLSVLEAVLALHRIDRIPITAAEAIVAAFLQEAGIVLIPMAEPETRAAIAAYARYGKGQGHPAQLNLGDCFSYACARTQGAPLLYVGNDFSQTDIPSALT